MKKKIENTQIKPQMEQVVFDLDFDVENLTNEIETNMVEKTIYDELKDLEKLMSDLKTREKSGQLLDDNSFYNVIKNSYIFKDLINLSVEELYNLFDYTLYVQEKPTPITTYYYKPQTFNIDGLDFSIYGVVKKEMEERLNAEKDNLQKSINQIKANKRLFFNQMLQFVIFENKIEELYTKVYSVLNSFEKEMGEGVFDRSVVMVNNKNIHTKNLLSYTEKLTHLVKTSEQTLKEKEFLIKKINKQLEEVTKIYG
jgi:hypothetical protein